MVSSSKNERPWVVYNVGMSLDGKTSTWGKDSRFSSEEDFWEVHQIRASVDGVLVGLGTLLQDNPHLTVRKIPLVGPQPTRLVVDSLLRIPREAHVLDGETPLVIGTTEKAQGSSKRELESKGARILVCGRDRVDLKAFLKDLLGLGIQKILLEGGGTLAHSMLFEGLVDEVRVALAPVIIGSEGGTSLAQGKGAETILQGVPLELLEQSQLGRSVILRYRVVK